jgi:uncharacterized membrane protein
MIKKLKESGRLNTTILLIILSLFSFGLSLFRILYTHSFEFLFLSWNLFLAFIPWFISSIIILKKLQGKKFLLVIMILSWVIFFPNSPYILTDLFHLGMSSKAPLWYDLILILSFAWAGLLFGFVSLMDIEKVLESYVGKGRTTFISIGFLFLSGFGIYIGRYLRWNSWDIILSPFALSSDIFSKISHPIYYSRAWGLTLFIGLFLNLIYFSFKLFSQEQKSNF